MLTELVTFAVGVVLAFAIGYTGYQLGRDNAEKRAGVVIANYRRQLMAVRAANDRLTDRNLRLSSVLRDAMVRQPEPPEWMR